MKNLLFVVNPRSGKEQLRTRLLDIIDLFNKYGYKVTIHITQDSQDAAQVVRECAQGQDLLVCSGGDGTLNEVVSGLMSMDRDCRRWAIFRRDPRMIMLPALRFPRSF